MDGDDLDEALLAHMPSPITPAARGLTERRGVRFAAGDASEDDEPGFQPSTPTAGRRGRGGLPHSRSVRVPPSASRVQAPPSAGTGLRTLSARGDGPGSASREQALGLGVDSSAGRPGAMPVPVRRHARPGGARQVPAEEVEEEGAVGEASPSTGGARTEAGAFVSRMPLTAGMTDTTGAGGDAPRFKAVGDRVSGAVAPPARPDAPNVDDTLKRVSVVLLQHLHRSERAALGVGVSDATPPLNTGRSRGLGEYISCTSCRSAGGGAGSGFAAVRAHSPPPLPHPPC